MAKTPTEVDRQVGTRVRARRLLIGMSQEKLAVALGITFQQVQKYENGKNRMSAGRLDQVARALGVPVSAILRDGLDDPEEVIDEDLIAFLSEPGARNFMRGWLSLKPRLRKRLTNLVVELASELSDGKE